MFRFSHLAAALLPVLALAPCAHATSIFVYQLSSDTSYYGQTLSGSITIEGEDGAAVPLLDSPAVQSWQFNASFVHWNSSTAQVQADNLTFNGTLGAATLQATAGDWQVYYGPESNAYLALYGQPSSPFYERWGWCTSSQSCAATGDVWQLTLVSETPEAPEPSTAALAMGAVAAFGVGRARRKKRV